MGNIIRKVIDQDGNIYKSVREFCKINDVARSYVQEMLLDNGYYHNKRKGIEAHYIDDDEETEQDTKEVIEDKEKQRQKDKQAQKDAKLLAKLKEQYSEEELLLLAKGRGLQDPNLKYPHICFTGGHHKFGVISDGHLGSKFAPLEFHYKAFQEFEKEHCEGIFHCGDVVDGLCPRRADTHIYELTHIGFKEQKDLAIEVFSKCNLPVYVISGNHDNWFQSMGANIVEDICTQVPCMTYLGHDQADIEVGDAIVRLFHGGDGSAYSRGYRLQKIVESYTGGKKPNILLAGHVHKFCYIFERMIHAVSVPTLQMQTDWMRGKKLPAHTGFLIIEFDNNVDGVCNFSVRLFPFYA